MNDDTAAVARVVKGGATMSPREDPRPRPLGTRELLVNDAKCIIRGPLLAVLVTRLAYPTFRRWVEAYVKRGGSEAFALAKAQAVLHASLYLGMFGLFEFCHQTGFLGEYKLFRLPSQEPTWDMKLRTLGEMAVASAINYLLAAKVMFPLLQRLGQPSALSPLPGLPHMFRDFVVAYLVNRIGFAVVHRIFHHGPLYRKFHKKHHTYVGSITIAAENADPVEATLANLSPTLAGCVALRSHPAVLLVWLAWRIEQTLEAHSGYCFYGTWPYEYFGLTNADSAAYHDHHHLFNRGNFGDETMDHLFGTQDHWISIGRIEGYVKMARDQHERERALKGQRM